MTDATSEGQPLAPTRGGAGTAGAVGVPSGGSPGPGLGDGELTTSLLQHPSKHFLPGGSALCPAFSTSKEEKISFVLKFC